MESLHESMPLSQSKSLHLSQSQQDYSYYYNSLGGLMSTSSEALSMMSYWQQPHLSQSVSQSLGYFHPLMTGSLPAGASLPSPVARRSSEMSPFPFTAAGHMSTPLSSHLATHFPPFMAVPPTVATQSLLPCIVTPTFHIAKPLSPIMAMPLTPHVAVPSMATVSLPGMITPASVPVVALPSGKTVRSTHLMATPFSSHVAKRSTALRHSVAVPVTPYAAVHSSVLPVATACVPSLATPSVPLTATRLTFSGLRPQLNDETDGRAVAVVSAESSTCVGVPLDLSVSSSRDVEHVPLSEGIPHHRTVGNSSPHKHSVVSTNGTESTANVTSRLVSSSDVPFCVSNSVVYVPSSMNSSEMAQAVVCTTHPVSEIGTTLPGQSHDPGGAIVDMPHRGLAVSTVASSVPQPAADTKPEVIEAFASQQLTAAEQRATLRHKDSEFLSSFDVRSIPIISPVSDHFDISEMSQLPVLVSEVPRPQTDENSPEIGGSCQVAMAFGVDLCSGTSDMVNHSDMVNQSLETSESTVTAAVPHSDVSPAARPSSDDIFMQPGQEAVADVTNVQSQSARVLGSSGVRSMDDPPLLDATESGITTVHSENSPLDSALQQTTVDAGRMVTAEGVEYCSLEQTAEVWNKEPSLDVVKMEQKTDVEQVSDGTQKDACIAGIV